MGFGARFVKLFEDPIKESIKTAIKLDPIDYMPLFETLGDQFTIGKKLDRASYGISYSATRNEDKKSVSLKYLKLSDVIYWSEQTKYEDKEPLEMFILKKAKNIVGVVALLDIFMLPEGYVLVMEAMPPTAKNIFSYAVDRFCGIKEEEIRFILKQIVEVLSDIHDMGVFIQGLTHENLLIEKDTRKIHLVDFGWATMVTSGFKNFYGLKFCTPHEMVSTGSFDAQPATVWSIGILAYMATARRPPFLTDKDIIAHKLTFSDRFSTELRDFITQCLICDPSERPTLQQLMNHHWMNPNCKIIAEGLQAAETLLIDTELTVIDSDLTVTDQTLTVIDLESTSMNSGLTEVNSGEAVMNSKFTVTDPGLTEIGSELTVMNSEIDSVLEVMNVGLTKIDSKSIVINSGLTVDSVLTLIDSGLTGIDSGLTTDESPRDASVPLSHG